MLQFLTYLLHKKIIEMRRSQNLRCPFLVPSQRLCSVNVFGFLRKADLQYSRVGFDNIGTIDSLEVLDATAQ